MLQIIFQPNTAFLDKLQDDIKAAKWLSVFLPKEKRQQIKELETSLANMIHLIESFSRNDIILNPILY